MLASIPAKTASSTSRTAYAERQIAAADAFVSKLIAVA
jgi:hypothetical protein